MSSRASGVSKPVGLAAGSPAPQQLRQRHAWGEGTALIAYETEDGVVVTTREALLARVREQLAGPSLAEQLIAEHRVEADRESSQ